ncbi:MAG: hypothetical protein PVG03_04725 [Desulfarculaceae bacterium]|jgi:hypothetical protein
MNGSAERGDLSGWLRERQIEGAPVPLLKYDFYFPEKHDSLGDSFRTRHRPRVHEKADNLLLALEKDTEHPGDIVELETGNYEKYMAMIWAANRKEFEYIIEILKKYSYVKAESFHVESEKTEYLTILPEGWARISDIEEKKGVFDQGFIAMDFKDEFKPLYRDAFEPAILSAGYRPVRMDFIEHIDRIDDRIEVEIKQSKFVVADLTGENSGVVYEMGFSRGCNIPTILTRKREEIKRQHFDFRQIHTLTWESLDALADFSERLSARIENVCGKGPLVPPHDVVEALRIKNPNLFPG